MLRFEHKVKGLDRWEYAPNGPQKDRWPEIAIFMRSTSLPNLGYMGTDGEYHYFMQRGVTTGYARVVLTDIHEERKDHD